MNTFSKRISLSRVAGLLTISGLLVGLMGSASAAPQTTQLFQANLTPLNSSGAYGTFTIRLNGDVANISGQVNGVSAALPHAQHLHFSASAKHMCPAANAKDPGGGLLTTADAIPDYGAVDASLTTNGDTSAKSALAVTRFPVASAQNSYTYNNSFTMTAAQVQHLKAGQYVTVVHGIDADGNGMYGGAAKSSLDPSLPLEATAPVSCGVMTAETTSTVIQSNGKIASQTSNGPAIVVAIVLGAVGVLLGLIALGVSTRRKA